MRAILRSRFVVVPAAIALFVLVWNVYVALHAHGLITGRVVDAAGRPVTGATVVLFERDFVTQNERARAVTGADGTFRFEANRSHLVQLEAQRGGEHSSRATLRLWFRAQDRALPEPLRLGPAG
jgi:hypothetical protein